MHRINLFEDNGELISNRVDIRNIRKLITQEHLNDF